MQEKRPVIFLKRGYGFNSRDVVAILPHFIETILKNSTPIKRCSSTTKTSSCPMPCLTNPLYGSHRRKRLKKSDLQCFATVRSSFASTMALQPFCVVLQLGPYSISSFPTIGPLVLCAFCRLHPVSFCKPLSSDTSLPPFGSALLASRR